MQKEFNLVLKKQLLETYRYQTSLAITKVPDTTNKKLIQISNKYFNKINS